MVTKAAKQGDLDALRTLGYTYENITLDSSFDNSTFSTNQKLHEAIKWYKKAAELGDVISQYRLAKIYSTYEDGAQYLEAIKWYRKAAEQGHVEAQYNLGNMYFRGETVKQDRLEAIKWYKKVAEQNNKKAMFNKSIDIGIYKNSQSCIQL